MKKHHIVECVALFTGEQLLEDIVNGCSQERYNSDGDVLHESTFLFDFSDVFGINISSHEGFVTIRFNNQDSFTIKMAYEQAKDNFIRSRND